MGQDLVYIYRADNDYKREILGEIQSDFNMSLVIDGTKDSMKVQVYSYENINIKPYSIIYHVKNETWWIVKSDKIEKHYNEINFLYIHKLQLLGAFDYLNSIDLTDCGFSNSRYTVRSVLFKLFRLSTIPDNWNIFIDNELQSSDDKTDVVDYIKTFENYTLMSAIREFLDGYNSVGKLEFIETLINGEYYINGLNLNIISKTGKGLISETLFNSVQEIVTMDYNSYGSSVVSNAENVVSTKAKTYPSIGAIKMCSNQHYIRPNNAMIKLPSPAFKVNWVSFKMPVMVYVQSAGGSELTIFNTTSKEVFTRDYERFSLKYATDYYPDNIQENYDIFVSYLEDVWRVVEKAGSVTFYNGATYNPQGTFIATGEFVPPENNPDFHDVFVYARDDANAITYRYRGLVYLTDRETYDSVSQQYGAFYWEKGSDIISGFTFVGDVSTNRKFTYINSYVYTDLKSNYYVNNDIVTFETTSGAIVHIELQIDDLSTTLTIDNTISQPLCFSTTTPVVVNYIPMDDLKVKYDNRATGNTSLLYNQNGRMTDSVALSKLILSYSKTIEEPNITRYGVFYDYNSIPKVGNVCIINNVKYVINNISYDFCQNENYGYEIECEFTLSANVATKSLLTNADTNIRDYGIPQKDNVKRKQLYRDFYEFDYVIDTHSDTDYYLSLSKNLNIGNFPSAQYEQTAVIKVGWEELHDNSITTPFGVLYSDSDTEIEYVSWYYQLDTINYIMKKSSYMVVDFKDNNIIGYSAQNAKSAFQVQRIFTGLTDNINTPISYVKDTGEQDDGTVKDISIAFCNSTQLNDIYSYYHKYVNNGAYANNYYRDLVNWSIFIDSRIYEGGDLGNGHILVGAKDNCDFQIIELDYDKDAVEVPVFEYCCQLDNSENILIGENILDNKEDDLYYFYSYVVVNKGTISEYDIDSLPLNDVDRYLNIDTGQIREETNDAVKLEYDNNNIVISLYSFIRYFMGLESDATQGLNQINYGSSVDLSTIDFTKKDLVIVRRTARTNQLLTGIAGVSGWVRDTKNDIMFVLTNVPSSSISDNKLTIKSNHYKLK